MYYAASCCYSTMEDCLYGTDEEEEEKDEGGRDEGRDGHRMRLRENQGVAKYEEDVVISFTLGCKPCSHAEVKKHKVAAAVMAYVVGGGYLTYHYHYLNKGCMVWVRMIVFFFFFLNDCVISCLVRGNRNKKMVNDILFHCDLIENQFYLL